MKFNYSGKFLLCLEQIIFIGRVIHPRCIKRKMTAELRKQLFYVACVKLADGSRRVTAADFHSDAFKQRVLSIIHVLLSVE